MELKARTFTLTFEAFIILNRLDRFRLRNELPFWYVISSYCVLREKGERKKRRRGNSDLNGFVLYRGKMGFNENKIERTI